MVRLGNMKRKRRSSTPSEGNPEDSVARDTRLANATCHAQMVGWMLLVGIPVFFAQGLFGFISLLAMVMYSLSLVLIYVALEWHRLRCHVACGFPPGPLTMPLFGSLLLIDKCEPQKSILKWKQQFGPVFTIALPVETVVICGVEQLRKAATMSETAARPDSYLYTIFLHNRPEGNGLILSSGTTWSKAKKFALEHLTSYGVMNGGIERRIEEHAGRMVAAIEGLLESEGDVVNLHEAISFTVASIICEIVLGRRYTIDDKKMKHLKKLLDQVLKQVQGVQMLVADNCPRLAQFLPADKEYRRIGWELQKFFLDELELNRMKERGVVNGETEEINPDSLIMKYINTPGALENGDLDLQSLAGDLWTGGMETTLTATRWAIIFLMQHPQVQAKVHDEIVQRYPFNSVGTFSYASRQELPYLCAVMDEVLRLANVLPWNIPHRALETFELDGHRIDKGTNLMFSFSAVNHDEKHFPQPYLFDPERFLRRDPDEEERAKWTEKGRHLEDFLVYEKNPLLCPFGMGTRRCPGEQLARKELFVFLIVLLQRYRFSVVESNPPDMARPMGMTSVPKDFVTRVERRTDWISHLPSRN